MHRFIQFFLLSYLIFGFNASNVFSQQYTSAFASFLAEHEYEGVILLYDYKDDQMYASNRLIMNDPVLPASTFKIFNSLLFLELGIVKDTSYTLTWDGTEYEHKGRRINAWCRDTNLAQAFRNSTVWYYVELSKSIEFSVYYDYLKMIEYGKVKIGKKDEWDFWNYGDKIAMSARDQIDFLVELYEDKLPFKKSHQTTVKELMIEKQTDNYTLRSKTGWTASANNFLSKKRDLGWYIGYVEHEGNVYFFATRLEKEVNKEDSDFSKNRKLMTKRALHHKFGIDLDH